MSPTRLALILPLAAALACAVPAAARAGDDAPAPRKRKVHVIIRRSAAKHAARRAATRGAHTPNSPLPAVRRWLLGRLGGKAGGAAGQGFLERWFAGGPDVPLAGLRDALRADGWNAKRLRAWIGREVAPVVARFLESSVHHAAPGGPGAWGPAARGSGRPAPGAAPGVCPRCGRPMTGSATPGPGAWGPWARGPWGWRRSGHGPGAGGPWAWGRGWGSLQAGPWGTPPWARGAWGRGGAAPGFRPGAGPLPPRSQGASARTRSWLLWNDGTGWHVQPWQAPASQVQALPGGGFTIQGRAQGAAPGQGALQGEMLRRLRQMLRGPEGRAALEGLLRAFGGTPTSAPPSVHVKKHVKLEKAESER